jgi:hypothetical protein
MGYCMSVILGLFLPFSVRETRTPVENSMKESIGKEYVSREYSKFSRCSQSIYRKFLHSARIIGSGRKLFEQLSTSVSKTLSFENIYLP